MMNNVEINKQAKDQKEPIIINSGFTSQSAPSPTGVE